MSSLQQQIRQIRLLALDVDGVLTNGQLFYGPQGESLKVFHSHDGLGLRLLMHAGIHVAIITSRQSDMVLRRAAELGISLVQQQQDDKLQALLALCQQLNLTLSQCAYCGDDLPDGAAIKAAGLGLSVPNAIAEIRACADWVTTAAAGAGAVREICQFILKAQDRWVECLEYYGLNPID